MISFSRDQSSLTPIGLDTQLDFTAVNSQLMSVLNKVPHRLETGLWDPQTGAVFRELLNEWEFS